MHLTALFVCGLLGQTLALPGNNVVRHYKNKPSSLGKNSVAAAITGTPSGVPPPSNATAEAFSTGRYHPHKGQAKGGPHHNDEASAGALFTSSTVSPVPSKGFETALDGTSPDGPVINDKHKVQSNECGAGTVTVTSSSVVTSTVSGDSSGSGGTASPTDGQISIESSPLQTSQSTPSPSGTSEQGSPSSLTISSSSPTAETSSPSVARPVPLASSSSNALATQSSPSNITDTAGSDTASSDTTRSSTTSSSASPSSQPSTAPSTSSGNLPFKTKRGIVADDRQNGDGSQHALAAAFANTKISWLCDHNALAPTTLAPSIEFVPQKYHGPKAGEPDGEDWRQYSEEKHKKDRYLISYGEPLASQPQISPEQAVQYWHQEMEPLAKEGIKVGSPTTLQVDHDYDWLDKFLKSCNDCTISFLNFHFIQDIGEVDRWFHDFNFTVHRAIDFANGKYPVWFDNIQAPDPSIEKQKEALKQAVDLLESKSEIVAYAFMPANVTDVHKDEPGLAGKDGMTELGRYYASL